jgi:hypothetical protein
MRAPRRDMEAKDGSAVVSPADDVSSGESAKQARQVAASAETAQRGRFVGIHFKHGEQFRELQKIVYFLR